jgi:hypothetical protein
LQIPCTEGGKQKKLQGGILKDFFAWGKEKLAYFAGVKQNPPTLQGVKIYLPFLILAIKNITFVVKLRQQNMNIMC